MIDVGPYEFVSYLAPFLMPDVTMLPSGVTTGPADPQCGGGGRGPTGPQIMALIFFTENLTQQFL